MVSLSLVCPLCCGEKFATLQSLRDHLVAAVENLSCSCCGDRFEGLAKLLEHLENESCAARVEEVAIKCEQDEIRDDLPKSILAKALLNKSEDDNGFEPTNDVVGHEELQQQQDNEGEDEEEEEGEGLYECSTCGTQFPSVEEHIREFHQGTEVLVLNDAVSAQQCADTEVGIEIAHDSDSQDEPGDDPLSVRIIKNEFPQMLNTVQQVDCLDRDGLVYTRKVVKIEKFWNDSSLSNGRPPPIVEKYAVENGRASKIEGEPPEGCTYVEAYCCPNCEVKYSKIQEYYKHKCPVKGKEFKCTKCKNTFPTMKSLKVHMKTHRTTDDQGDGSSSFICEECNTDFPSYKSLRLHRRMHDPVKSRDVEAPVTYGINGTTVETNTGPREMFICQICNKTYDKQYEEAHMDFHKNDNNYDCDVCNRKFYTQSNLEMHMRVHSNGKKFICSYCKKGFLTFESMQEHVQNQCQQRKYECQYCGRRFARPHEKVKHERIHTGEKPHVCGICGKSFRVSYCLTLHMRTHSGTRPYQCPYCSKRFKAHSVFNHHLLTHSDVRAYKCPYCPKAFKTGVQLAGHKNSHTKPFTCTQCNRPFASLYAVRSHMETHNRENNLKFKCMMCGASYARAFALRDHIKDHHGTEMNAEEPEVVEGTETADMITEEADFSALQDASVEAVQAIVVEE